jgi:hypothetical protein
MLHTAKCVGVWATVLAAAVLFSGGPALAQQANPLAPVIILNNIQNRRQEQELRETKRELKAIREGLGIEAPAPEPKPLSPAIAVLMALGVAIALALVFAGLWAQWLRDLSALRSRLANATKAGNTWAAYCVLCNLKSVAGQMFQAALFGLVIIVFSDIIYINAPWVTATDEQRKAMNDLVPSRLVVAAVIGGLFSVVWFGGLYVYAGRLCSHPRLDVADSLDRDSEPAGSVSSPPAAAQQFFGAPQATQIKPHTSGSRTARSLPSGRPKTADRLSASLWVKTPDGKQGGPYTKQQIIMAVGSGKIPADSCCSSSPTGPWHKIVINGA